MIWDGTHPCRSDSRHSRAYDGDSHGLSSRVLELKRKGMVLIRWEEIHVGHYKCREFGGRGCALAVSESRNQKER